MEGESFFLLNHEVNNPSSLGKGVPMTANYLACNMELPAGENYNDGRYYNPLTNEIYWFTYNSNGVNFISRINSDGICEIVYNGSCLVLSPDPKHEVLNWRVILDVDVLCNKVPGGKLKRLIWVDGTDTPVGSLDVEASIATNFFTTPFFERCANDCANLQLCVPEPDSCLSGEWVAQTTADAALSNFMLDKGFKFMYRYVYYDGRASEWSDRSSLYYQDAKGCFDNSTGFSRCMKFRIPIGNPLVDVIEFAFSEDGGLTWFIADRIEKYKKYNSTQQYWYERDLSEGVSNSFDEEDCTFEYTFCNDKGRIPVDPLQVSRELNPIPRSPQGLFRIKESIGFYNYIKGTCPLDKSEVDKFDIQLNCTEDSSISCNTEYAKVTVRAIIYNEFHQRNAFIYRLGGGDGVADDSSETAWFGGTDGSTVAPLLYQGYDQNFNEKTRNFIAYIEGTNYWGEMEQYRSTPNFNSQAKVGVLGGLASSNVRIKKNNDIDNGNFYVQQYTFTVPKGTKGFIRLTSHHQTSGVSSNQNTSTQVIGTLNSVKNYTGDSTISGVDPNNKEIYFDTCDGDYETFEAFIVADFYNITGSDQSSAYNGYITDKNNQPVEGARIYRASTYQTTTDFNGFYAFYKVGGTSNSITPGIYVEQNCSGDFTQIETFATQSSEGTIANVDYQIQSEIYRDDFYAIVDVPVTDCNNIPIHGIRVAMKGSKYKVSGTDGIAHFKLRNYNTRARDILGVVMDKGNCFIVDCDNNCHPCFPTTASTGLAPCFQNTPEYILPILTRLNASSLTVNRVGLKHGGRYALGWVAEGDCGWLSSVNETRYIDIPRVQESGNLSFCNFAFTANVGSKMILPPQTKRIKIVRSVNLNPYDLQWVVDQIDRTSDGKIKLTIQSLNDYNAQYNFKTNTVYKYLQGDRVEFIRNGDGKIFDTATNGILNYLTLSPFNDEVISGVTNDANYFNQLIITDDGKLDGLVIGAVIELQTPSVSTSEVAYFEICASIEVENGQFVIPSGTFTTFDTFLVNRQIGKFPAQYFESKTPSDFWGGTNLDDTGKVHFVNKYANERRYGRNISINSPTQLNYFGDFERTLDAIEQGDIIAIALKGDKLGLAICENSPFLFQVSDDLVRIGTDNIIRAVPVDRVISSPEVNLRGDYGCQYSDIGSIFFGDGYALWIDSKHDAYITHNYSFAKQTGQSINKGVIETSCSSFFRKRIRDKENFNSTSTDFLNHYRFSTGINKNTNVVFLTTKAWRHAGINNEKEVYAAPNDTIIYNPENDTFLGFVSFTPEGYSQLNLNSETGASFIAFQNSLPYIHPVIADKWNEFFDISCDWVVGITLNKFIDKIKVPVSMEIQSEIMWYVSKVTTEMSQSRSEVPPIKMKQNQAGKWNAAFLNDINSRGGLYNGANMRGYAHNVLYIRDNTLNLTYNSIDNNKRVRYSELDNILLKCQLSEQSGFTENL